jgi:hypothetical protein
MFTDFGPRLENPFSSIPFGPDLLPEINCAWKPRTKEEDDCPKKAEFGAIQCIFCGSITRPYDSPLILQSLIKSERHYVLEGIFRELGLVVGNAKHLVFAGYSLPMDDYIYRCFFQAAWAGKELSQEKKFFTLINYDPGSIHLTPGNTGWLEGDDIHSYLKIDIGRPSQAFPDTPPGIRVTYHGGSIELSITRYGHSRKTD